MEMVIQNQYYRLNKDPKFCHKNLRRDGKLLTKKWVDYALDKLMESDDLSTIKKFAKRWAKRGSLKALERDSR